MPDDEADPDPPSGYSWPGPPRMSEAEAMELLASEGLGRLVYNGLYGPTALPVVYKSMQGRVNPTSIWGNGTPRT